MKPPKRIQLRRTKGWRKPEGAIVCTRPGRWGNPFTAEGCREAGYQGDGRAIAERCVEAFRVWLGPHWRENWDGPESERRRQAILSSLHELRGRDLCCWCPLDAPCHVDVLLEIANDPTASASP